ncbi:hypothetical protein KDD30_00775 [Photobacterium sp. GJ3]|uniref:hypothetical protein n=1 Tax=Photobacterium sp. GJ3 TaxID=2829502 RepID=UPI001B8CD020|nr:hypothetical protein [Photobacterium sp. GJ3]QUJ67747.1 hypothetical protein KDD30_00775 [Photobacterium sp. GJ3]
MSFLLRKISANKWEPNLGKISSQHTADAITGCTRTSNNTLSVWHSNTKEFEDESVKKLIVALAVSMPQPAKIDVLWLEEDWLVQQGLNINSNLANTCYRDVNPLHKDIEFLDHGKLGIVSEHIVNQLSLTENRHSISRPKLIRLVGEWLEKDNTFELDELNEKWRAEIVKVLKRKSC